MVEMTSADNRKIIYERNRICDLQQISFFSIDSSWKNSIDWRRRGDERQENSCLLLWIKLCKQEAVGSCNKEDFPPLCAMHLLARVDLRGLAWVMNRFVFDQRFHRQPFQSQSFLIYFNFFFRLTPQQGTIPTTRLTLHRQKQANRVQFSILPFIYGTCICWNCFPYLI